MSCSFPAVNSMSLHLWLREREKTYPDACCSCCQSLLTVYLSVLQSSGGYEHEDHAAEAFDVAALKTKGKQVCVCVLSV